MMRRAVALGVVAAVGILFTYALYSGAPPYGSFPVRVLAEEVDDIPVSVPGSPGLPEGHVHSIGAAILEGSPKMPPEGTGASNAVTGVLWGYRAYDTLGEATVLFASVVGVVMVSQAGLSVAKSQISIGEMTVIARTVARVVFPFASLFGIYLMVYGHLTPGGGFPGGVVVAASIVVLLLTFGLEFTSKKFGFIECEICEEIGAIAIMGVGLGGLFAGSYFFESTMTGGEMGQLFGPVNMVLLNLAVGLKVATGLLLILYALLGPLGGEEH